MTVGVGILGCGLIARFHAFCLNALVRGGHVDAHYTAVYDSDPDRAAAFGTETGAALVATDADALVEHPDVDAVYVCTPTAAHAELVARAAAAGKAVFCEKPLAFHATCAWAMTDAVESAGVVDQVGLVLRYSPTFRAVARHIEAGRDGRPMGVVLRDDQFFPVQGHYASQWRKDPSLAGSGVLLEHSIHDVDVLEWLLGPIAAVSALTRNFAGHPGIEDLAVVTFEFESGAVGSLVTLWHDVRTRPSTRRLEVFCEDALFTIADDQVGPLSIARSSGDVEVAAVDVVVAAVDELGAPAALADPVLVLCLEDWVFLEAVRTGRRTGPGFDVALRAHTVVDAAYESAAEGGRRQVV